MPPLVSFISSTRQRRFHEKVSFPATFLLYCVRCQMTYVVQSIKIPMSNFSQRLGLKPSEQVIQTSSMNSELRNSLWNALHFAIWESDDFMHHRFGKMPRIDSLSKILWFRYFKKPVDEIPSYGYQNRSERILKIIREHFFLVPWNEVYEFLEFIVEVERKATPKLAEFLNKTLEQEMSGFRFIGNILSPVTGDQERLMLEAAIVDPRFTAVGSHLERALAMLAHRTDPDYRNSIKESMSAVEAMARIIADDEKATLGQALKMLKKNRDLHPTLLDGFSKLYGYTSDENGVRHAMMEEPDLNQDDAKYFLLSCTSFVNYLKAALVQK